MSTYKISCEGRFLTKTVHSSGVALITDAPKETGGEGKYFSPTDLLAISLGSCALTIMRQTAAVIHFDMSEASAEVTKTMSQDKPRRISAIVLRIRCPKLPANDTMRARLEKAATDCPVHLALHESVDIRTEFLWGL